MINKAIANLNLKNLKGEFKDVKIIVEYYNYDRSNDNREKNFDNKIEKPVKKRLYKKNKNYGEIYENGRKTCLIFTKLDYSNPIPNIEQTNNNKQYHQQQYLNSLNYNKIQDTRQVFSNI